MPLHTEKKMSKVGNKEKRLVMCLPNTTHTPLIKRMCANGGSNVVILLQLLLTNYFGFLSDFLIVSTWLYYKKYKKASNINHYREFVLG